MKSIYVNYRYWCEDRGERPLAQSNFQRKLIDRAIKIEGSGGKAEIIGRTLPLVSVPDNVNSSENNPFAFGRLSSV